MRDRNHNFSLALSAIQLPGQNLFSFCSVAPATKSPGLATGGGYFVLRLDLCDQRFRMYTAIEAAARAEQRTKSELIGEAFRSYQFIRRWRVLRQMGTETAARLEIESDEVLEAFLG
jgi:hypothetical protein